MANVDEVDAMTVAATIWTEMTHDDVIEGVAATATCTATKIAIKAATAAMATVTMTVGMRIATATQEDRALSGMIALLCGLHPHHLGTPLGAQVPHMMTTPGDILTIRRHLKMTDPAGQIHHLRMAPLGVSRKTCTEGTSGWTEGVTTLNGKWLYVSACQNPHIFFTGADNNVSIIRSVSGRRPLVLQHGICAYSLFSSSTLYSISTL